MSTTLVFLIQRSRNKEALAIHLKLNEIIATMEGARKSAVNVEDLSETEVAALEGALPAPRGRHRRGAGVMGWGAASWSSGSGSWIPSAE